MTADQENTEDRAARELRGLMAQQNKRTGELADLLGISQQSASRRKTGETPLGLHEVGTIAEWLGVPVAQLLGTAA